MPTSEFLAFGTGGGANVESQANYAAASWRDEGFSAGLAQSPNLNKVWRQSSVAAAALTQAVADLTASNIADDGDLAGLVAKIKAAIAAGAGGVASFNTRTGAVTMTLSDVNAAMTGKVSLHSDPTSALHAATKQYVDNVASGLQPKAAVACASTANLTLSGEQTIDGVLTSASRVLVKNQSAPAQNGVYVTAAGAWARATDMDAWTEVPGALVYVTAGTANAGRRYVCTSAAGGTLDTNAISWEIYDSGTVYTGSGGISVTGTNFVLTDMAEARVKGRAAGAGTGAPTDLTPAQLAAMLDLAAVLSSDKDLSETGYISLGGLILQWGRYAGGSSSPTITFPKQFPTACFAVIPVAVGTAAASSALVSSSVHHVALRGTPTTTSFQAWCSWENETPDVFVASTQTPFHWFAVGK